MTITPPTREEMAARINGYDGPKPRMVEIARRTAFYDVEEAKIQAELRQATSANATWEQAQETKLAGITACRGIEGIMDSLGNAWEVRASALAPVKEAVDALEAMKERAACMEGLLSDLRARDVREELENYCHLENELEKTEKVLTCGSFTQASRDGRAEAFRKDLENLTELGLYHGEPSEEGAIQRAEELKKLMADLEQRAERQLSAAEISKMNALEPRLAGINAEIAKTAFTVEAITQAAASAESKFHELRETALVTVEGILEVHRIRTGNPKTPASR